MTSPAESQEGVDDELHLLDRDRHVLEIEPIDELGDQVRFGSMPLPAKHRDGFDPRNDRQVSFARLIDDVRERLVAQLGKKQRDKDGGVDDHQSKWPSSL